MLGGLIGAVLALGGGYAALRYGPPGLVPMPEASGLAATVSASADEIAALKAQIAELLAPLTVDPVLVERVTALETALAAVHPAAGPFGAGVQACRAGSEGDRPGQPVAPAPVVTGDASEAMQAIAALQAEIAALKSGKAGRPRRSRPRRPK
ncbi:MAG: hypothetical protein HZT43_01120 [Exiguobacterium profundum]|nr:MAG: hypothetical protein HZT43_01120 [Exiguobacterium profundum]